MGIKNIHLVLMFFSFALAILLGWWAKQNGNILLLFGSVIVALGLIAYISIFVKKMKTL